MKTRIDDLPDLALYAILDRLPVEDLLRVDRVSQRWALMQALVVRNRRNLTLMFNSFGLPYSIEFILDSKLLLLNGQQEDNDTLSKKLHLFMVEINTDKHKNKVDQWKQLATLFPKVSRLQLILKLKWDEDESEILFCKNVLSSVMAELAAQLNSLKVWFSAQNGSWIFDIVTNLPTLKHLTMHLDIFDLPQIRLMWPLLCEFYFYVRIPTTLSMAELA